MSAIQVFFLSVFLSVFSSFLHAEDFDIVKESNILIIVNGNQISGTDDNTGHVILEKKYFRIGKKIFKNPLYRSPRSFRQDKVSAIFIIMLTGPLGGHRLYLGTKPVVPVVYAVTLGGGIGILPLLDMFAIIFTRDLNRYIDNDKIIMWVD